MEKSSFFNSANHDRRYSAEDWAAYFSSFIGNGVYARPSNGLQVIASGGMGVTVKAGAGFINGYFYRNTADLPVTVGVADGIYPRIDRMVLRWSLPFRKITTELVPGTPASNPVPPVPANDPETVELATANIMVRAGATSILQSDITDLRADPALCGFVHAIVDQFDFSTFSVQFDEFCQLSEQEFDTWFENLQYVLDGDVAGHLQNQIDDLNQLNRDEASQIFIVSIDWNDWVKENDYYVKTISVPGMRAGDTPIVDIDVYNEAYETTQYRLEEWSRIFRITTDTDKIKVYSSEPITTSGYWLSIKLLCIRK